MHYSKTECPFVHRQAITMSDVNTSKASSGQIWCQNMMGKFGANVDVGRSWGNPWRTILTRWYEVICACPPLWGWPQWNCDEGLEKGDITVDRELAYPAAPHPTCVAADACQGSCLEVHWLWWTWPPLWSWWWSGTPYPLWRSCQVRWNDLWFWHVHKWGGALRYSLYLFPKVLPVSPIYSILHPRWSHLYLQMTSLLFVMLSLSLGATNRPLIVLLPLMWTWTPALTHTFLKLSLSPLE